MIYLRLFFEFAKAGLFAIGGGLATLPFLQDISLRTAWYTSDQLADMIAVSECTPGPIGVNMSTYTGYAVAGVPGAVVATLGLIFPSVVVIIIVAKILKSFQDNKYVKAAFYGLRPASTGLIAAACLGVAQIALLQPNAMESLKSAFSSIRYPAVILAVILWLLMNLGTFKRLKGNRVLSRISKLHPVVFLAVSAIVGIIFKFGA